MNEWQRIWCDLVSMPTGLLLMGVIAMIAIVTTLAFPAADVFHTGLFQALLGLLCINMFFCTIRQIKQLWNSYRWLTPPAYVNYPKTRITVSATDNLVQRIETFLVTSGYRYKLGEEAQQLLICADKGMIGRYAAIGVHVAILMIALGALVGNLLGFMTTVNVGVGDAAGFPLEKNAIRQAEIRLTDFQIEYYPDGNVAEYTSVVQVTAGQVAIQDEIKVNHPLKICNVVLYQTGYGYQARVDQYANGTSKSNVWLLEDGRFQIDAVRNIEVQMIRYVPDFDPRRPTVSRSHFPNNPKILYAIYQNGQPLDWGVADVGQHIRIPDMEGWVQFSDTRSYSTLDVKYDPGIFLVFPGFVLLAIAFFASLYTRRYHQLFLTVVPIANEVIVTITAFRLPVAKKNRLLAELSKVLLEREDSL
jgi:cytochrome c biogenesis protein